MWLACYSGRDQDAQIRGGPNAMGRPTNELAETRESSGRSVHGAAVRGEGSDTRRATLPRPACSWSPAVPDARWVLHGTHHTRRPRAESARAMDTWGVLRRDASCVSAGEGRGSRVLLGGTGS
jgi:hypothetical protein